MMTVTPSIFESFNARALRPSQVAKTFVPSRHYDVLANRANTLLVGPRGSGKTTLLKMLQQPALEAWQHNIADHYRAKIDFTGVFIATDIAWAAQIEALGGGELDLKSHHVFAAAAFCTHVLRSLIIAMISRTRESLEEESVRFRRVLLSDSEESHLAKALARAWYLEPAIPSLLSVKQALSERLKRISEMARREVTLGPNGRSERLGGIDFLHLDFLQASAVATEQFDDLTQEYDSRWALMFDELEIAPRWVRDDLIRMLRSTDSRFLFKLALNPFSQNILPLEDALGPAPDHDYEQIQLWYAERYEGYAFCEDLWYSMLEERQIPRQKPTTALGTSVFETDADEWRKAGNAYQPSSRLGNLFEKLASTDKSFAHYLRKKGINPKALHLVEPNRRAAHIRKVAPILPIRDFYRAPERDIPTRGRKKPSLYTGAEAVFAISEGNPRLFIAIVGKMLDRWANHQGKLKERIQADEVKKGAERFSALLRTIPVSGDASLAEASLLFVLDKIGQYFHSQIVGPNFVAEPPGTFTVDSSVPEPVVESLGQALNAGAIVFVPEERTKVLLRSLRGERFRLSYLLAPRYGVALRLGRRINLGSILRGREERDGLGEQLTILGDEGDEES